MLYSLLQGAHRSPGRAPAISLHPLPLALLLLVLIVMGSVFTRPGDAQRSEGPQSAAVAPEKVGAGLLLSCQGEVLLLLRAGNRNANTWGLPGGNADATDADLLATATREAIEEMGGVPPFTVLDKFLTKRGKRGQKHYTVFVAAVDPAAKAAFEPKLNSEHSAWRWLPFEEACQRADLHPVVSILMAQGPNRNRLGATLQSAGRVT